jgi:Peptidase family M41
VDGNANPTAELYYTRYPVRIRAQQSLCLWRVIAPANEHSQLSVATVSCSLRNNRHNCAPPYTGTESLSVVTRAATVTALAHGGAPEGVDEEVRRITDECYAEARRLLRENRGKLDRIVEQLLIRETLDEPEVYAAAGIERPAAPAKPVLALPQLQWWRFTDY